MPARSPLEGLRASLLALGVAALSLLFTPPSFSRRQTQSAPQNQQSPQNSPAISIVRSTRLVQVSAVVTDKSGNPVTDLAPADFTILDDGHPQKVQLFRTETSQPPAPAATSAAPPPDTYSNQIAGRAAVPPNITIVLIDGLNTLVKDQSYARAQAVKFLQQIEPGQRIAIYTLGHDLRVLQDFTSDGSVLAAALRKYSGQSDAEVVASDPQELQTGNADIDAALQDAFQREANMFIQDRVETTVAALIDIANHAAALPGRKNLLWVSGSFPFSVMFENLQSINQMMNSPGEANLTNQQRFFAEDVDRAARALNDADVAVYPVDARGLLAQNLNLQKISSKGPGYTAMNTIPPQQTSATTGGRGSRRGSAGGAAPRAMSAPSANANRAAAAQAATSVLTNPDTTTFETMSALADDTGGRAFYNTNDIASSLHAAIDDSRFSYELGYYPADINWDGKFHNITVRINRKDIVVRSRKGYFALPAPVIDKDALQAIVKNAVFSPLDATGVALAVRMKPAQSTSAASGAVTALVFFDPNAVYFDSKDGRFSGNVGALFVQLDAKNQVVHTTERSFPLNFSADQYAQFSRQQVEFRQDLTLAPNATQMRVVFWDGATGKTGAVAVPLAKYAPAPSSTSTPPKSPSP
jgi:VWFA-related protein